MPGLKKVWLGGLSPSGKTASSSDPAHPVSYGITDHVGMGLMPLDDISQVHVLNFSGDDHIGWSDNQRVVPPRATQVVRWAILPTARPDYWALVNAARRFRDVNFTLPGSFAFLRAQPKKLTGTWSDRQFADFIRFKDAHFVCDGYSYPSYKGRFPHGTAFQMLDWTYLRGQMARLRRLAPDAQHLLYFHCFIDVLDEAPEKYADARLLMPDGRQADYGQPYDRIFIPTQTNAFGRDIATNVDLILGPPPQGFGCEGVYWDEFPYSRYQYHYADFSRPGGIPWDGVSADIDPRTMQDRAAQEQRDARLAALPPRPGPADSQGPRAHRQRPAAYRDHDQAPLPAVRRDRQHLELRGHASLFAHRPGRSPHRAERAGRLPLDAAGLGFRLRLLLVQRSDGDPHAPAPDALHVPHHAAGAA